MLDYSAIPDQKDHHHLGTRINIATRSAHTKLNRSLLLRLPLALPPKATTPSVYVTGLVHVAPIYIAFESKWRDIVNWEPTTDEEEVKTASIEQLLDDVSLDNENENSEGDDGRPKTSPHMHSILKHLNLPVLERSARLKADIRSITGWTEAEVDEQIRQAAERGELGKFISHIKRSINEHPHVLLAYAWVLYMALFAGGRFIRGSLENAGAEFWDTTCEPVLPSRTPCNKPGPASPTSPQNQKPLSICNFGPLSFFRFAGPQDGEDLKVEFKKRLLDSESRFSTKELDDIVYEATHIFDYMNSLVAQLDAVF
ncbi:heme-binding protein HMX1, partial [Rhypophila decipiens]